MEVSRNRVGDGSAAMLEGMSKRSRIATVAASAGLALAVTVTAYGASTSAGKISKPCTGSQLGATFKPVRGSAGAGHISYKLVLRNRSRSFCFVTGVPNVTLIAKGGTALPTAATFSGRPGMLTAVMVPLAPGKAAHLIARFSPDVPGPGEQVKGACERTAYKLRVVTSGGGRSVAPIAPVTPVCEHGSMQLTVLTSGA